MAWIRRGVLSLLIVVAVSSLYLSAHGQAGSSAKTLTAKAPSAATTPNATGTSALDFEFFKTKVEPIFLKKRADHAPCYGCHILPNLAFRLQTLSSWVTTWT